MTKSLRDIIASDNTDTIASYFDGLDGEQRIAAIRSLGWSSQKRLYDLAADNVPLTLDDFVGPSVQPLEVVRHHGWNVFPEVPLVPDYKRFRKPFCRQTVGADRLVGYNDVPIGETIGPGYFVALATSDVERERGGVVIDYTLLPDGNVPSGWPPVVSNSKGLQYFVYRGTRDYMRRLSRHVTIGAAYKGNRRLGAYFLLTREDAAGVDASTEGVANDV